MWQKVLRFFPHMQLPCLTSSPFPPGPACKAATHHVLQLGRYHYFRQACCNAVLKDFPDLHRSSNLGDGEPTCSLLCKGFRRQGEAGNSWSTTPRLRNGIALQGNTPLPRLRNGIALQRNAPSGCLRNGTGLQACVRPARGDGVSPPS